jgi:2,3-bisphosphoglycerate-independent phosphoglycerate mutase
MAGRHMSEKKTIALVIMDGLGDRPNPLLHDRTPMESAYMPNLNKMARRSLCGVMYPYKQGIVCGSDTSHLSILGYDPEKYYTGRGPFEALGLGMEVQPGDIAFRANYATRNNLIVKDRRAGRMTESTESLSKSLCMEIDDIKVEVASGVEHRAALILKGSELSDQVTDTDPHEVGKGVRLPEAKNKASIKTSYILKEFQLRSRKILNDHPFNKKLESQGRPLANELLLRGAGMVPRLESFKEKYGMTSAYIIGIPMIKGLAELLKMKHIDVPGITGSVDTNYIGKIKAISDNIGKYDFILTNIKATDVAAHDKDPRLKKEVMERIDEAMEPLLSMEDNALIILTGDHSTSSLSGEHTGDPVPIMFYTNNQYINPAEGFNERACSKTGFNIEGGNVMNYALQLTERLEKYGA